MTLRDEIIEILTRHGDPVDIPLLATVDKISELVQKRVSAATRLEFQPSTKLVARDVTIGLLADDTDDANVLMRRAAKRLVGDLL